MRVTSNRFASEGQGVKLVSSKQGYVLDELELFLLDPAHGLDTRDDGASAAKRLESEHWSHDASDGGAGPFSEKTSCPSAPHPLMHEFLALDAALLQGMTTERRCGSTTTEKRRLSSVQR